MPTLLPASSVLKSATIVTASRTIALSRLARDLLLLKLALAALVAASRLVLLSGISGCAVQAAAMLAEKIGRRCYLRKDGLAASACKPAFAEPVGALLDIFLAQLASSHLPRQCDHHGFKRFHWLHLLTLAALQMAKGPATCQTSRLHFFIHLFQLC